MPGNDREGVNCTFSNGNKLAPTIINRIKVIRMEKEESWYLDKEFNELEFGFTLKYRIKHL